MTPLDGFHAIIKLDTIKLMKYSDSVTFDATKAAIKTSRFKNLMDDHDKDLLELSFIDPLKMYMNDLTTHFGDLAFFFADIYGGDKVAVVFKTEQLAETEFKVNVGYNSTLTGETRVIDGVKLIFRMERVYLRLIRLLCWVRCSGLEQD